MLLRIAFTVAPILFGLDKFAEVMISDWPKYLAPEFNDIIPGSAQDAMYIVGVVEIAAGLVVAFSPRFGGLLVAGWLGGHHRQPAAGRRLRRHRAARLRPPARRADPVAARHGLQPAMSGRTRQAAEGLVEWRRRRLELAGFDPPLAVRPGHHGGGRPARTARAGRPRMPASPGGADPRAALR